MPESKHKASQLLRRIDCLIDLWLTSSTPPRTPPNRPLPSPPPPPKPKKRREDVKSTVNQLLLRAHVALIYSSQGASSQALCYADRAYDLTVEHRLPVHRARAQWLRGESLASMERWDEAYEAFVGSARLVVAGGWRKEAELRERMDLCWAKKQDQKTKKKMMMMRGKSPAPAGRCADVASLAGDRRDGKKQGQKTVRFHLGSRDDQL